MYKCGWNGCEKAYGTLNHLNAHVTMQSHGQKRTPEGKSNRCPRSHGTHAPSPGLAGSPPLYEVEWRATSVNSLRSQSCCVLAELPFFAAIADSASMSCLVPAGEHVAQLVREGVASALPPATRRGQQMGC